MFKIILFIVIILSSLAPYDIIGQVNNEDEYKKWISYNSYKIKCDTVGNELILTIKTYDRLYHFTELDGDGKVDIFKYHYKKEVKTYIRSLYNYKYVIYKEFIIADDAIRGCSYY